jgi:hypothetical protein
MAYIGKSPSNGIRNRFIYTATAGQTSFSGSDDHNRTLNYNDAEFVDVFLNGVKLDKSDYTATSGTSVVLDEGAAVDDILEVIAFDVFSVFSGEFSQDVTVGGTLDVQGGEVILDADGDTSITADTDDQIDFKTGGSDRVTISSSGHLTKPYTPAFYANKSAVFSTDYTDIVFDTVRTNVGSHYSSSNGKFTAPVTGVYFFSFGSLIDTSTASTDYAYLDLTINGSRKSHYRTHTSYNNSRNYEPLTWTGVVELTSGDEVTVQGEFGGSSSTYGGSSYTFFSGYLLG